MKTNITNCDYLLKFRCPKNWENLSLTEDAGIRYCGACRKNVHLCETLEEVGKHSGKCIAIKLPHTENLSSEKSLRALIEQGGLVMGENRK